MNRKCYLYLIICTTLYSTIVLANDHSGEISFNILIKKGGTISLTYTGANYRTETIRLLKVTSDTSFQQTLWVDAPIVIYSKANKINPYIFSAKDSIQFFCDEKGMIVRSLRSDSLTKNCELSFFERLCSDSVGLSMDLYFNSITRNEFLKSKLYDEGLNKAINTSYKNSLAFLKNYENKYKLTERAKQRILLVLKYNYINNLLLHYYNKRFFNKITAPNYKNLMDSIRKDFFATPYNLNNFYFRSALFNYNSYLGSVPNTNDFLVNFHALYNSAITNFSDSLKNYILFELMNRVAYTDKTIFNDNYLSFTKNCTDDNLKQRIKAIYQNSHDPVDREQKKLFDRILTVNNKVISFNNLLKSNDSCLIFLDFWASWCAPCLQEIPFSASLQNLYSTKKIRFIYVSLDELPIDWLEKIKAHPFMNENNSFLLKGGFQSAFARNAEIKSIPRYMLLSPSGTIISSNAPRPSDDELKILLDKYLN